MMDKMLKISCKKSLKEIAYKKSILKLVKLLIPAGI